MKIKINQLLEESGKTKYWLMQKTGATYQTIHRLCSGQTRSIQFDTLEKICIAFNCQIQDILEVENGQNHQQS